MDDCKSRLILQFRFDANCLEEITRQVMATPQSQPSYGTQAADPDRMSCTRCQQLSHGPVMHSQGYRRMDAVDIARIIQGYENARMDFVICPRMLFAHRSRGCFDMPHMDCPEKDFTSEGESGGYSEFLEEILKNMVLVVCYLLLLIYVCCV